MSKFATLARFGDYDLATGALVPGTWYSQPPESPWRKEDWVARANLCDQLLRAMGLTPAAPRSDAGPRCLVAGCGLGHLAWELWDRGWSAWGGDGSWAATKGRVKVPNISDHILEMDATLATSVRNVKVQAGIGQNQRFAACITDDLLSAADDDANATAMLTALRAHVTAGRFIHLVTMHDPTQGWSGTLSPEQQNDGLWKTEAAWLTLIGNNAERVVNMLGYRIVR